VQLNRLIGLNFFDFDRPFLIIEHPLLQKPRIFLADLPFGRKCFGHQIITMFAECRLDSGGPGYSQHDSVGHFESGLLARFLHGANKLPCNAFTN